MTNGRDLKSHPCGTNTHTEIQSTEAGLPIIKTGEAVRIEAAEVQHSTICSSSICIQKHSVCNATRNRRLTLPVQAGPDSTDCRMRNSIGTYVDIKGIAAGQWQEKPFERAG